MPQSTLFPPLRPHRAWLDSRLSAIGSMASPRWTATSLLPSATRQRAGPQRRPLTSSRRSSPRSMARLRRHPRRGQRGLSAEHGPRRASCEAVLGAQPATDGLHHHAEGD